MAQEAQKPYSNTIKNYDYLVQHANTELNTLQKQLDYMDEIFGNISRAFSVSMNPNKLSFYINYYVVLNAISVAKDDIYQKWCDVLQITNPQSRTLLVEHFFDFVKAEAFPGERGSSNPIEIENCIIRKELLACYQALDALPNKDQLILFCALVESIPQLFKQEAGLIGRYIYLKDVDNTYSVCHELLLRINSNMDLTVENLTQLKAEFFYCKPAGALTKPALREPFLPEKESDLDDIYSFSSSILVSPEVSPIGLDTPSEMYD